MAPGIFFAGAILQLLLGPWISARAKGVLAFAASLPALAAVVATLPAVWGGRAILVHAGIWDGPLALILRVDALSVFFALMGSAIGAMVLLYSISYMEQERSATRFYVAMMVFIGGFLALVYSANLFVFYLFWELVGLCSFSLVGFWYTNPAAVRGARKVLLMTHVAGYGLLAAILLLFVRTGATLWFDPRLQTGFTTGVFALMLVAILAKSVQFPLHTWIPEAMAAPTPVSALLHAACYVKAGVYLAARMHGLGHWPAAWGAALVWIGAITMAVGVLYAMVQTDLKRMLAYSTVSQIGYMMMGLGVGTPLAIVAALLHCLNHSFFKGGLFLTAGSVQHAAHTRDMNHLGGLAQRMPKTTLSWLVGAGAMAGLPLMSGFASKWLLYSAALEAGWTIPTLVAWLASLGTVFLCAKATSAVFLGPASPATEHAQESPATMLWGMGLLAAGSLILGVAPQLAVNLLLNPVVQALGLGAGAQVSWFGLSTETGLFSTAGGLTLAVVSLVAGALVYWLSAAGRRSAHAEPASSEEEIFTGGEPLEANARLSARDFSLILEQNWRGFFAWTQVDHLYLTTLRGILTLSRALARPLAALERHAAPALAALAAALFALLYWALPGGQTHAMPHLFERLALQPTLIVSACAVAGLALTLAALALPGSRKSAPLILATSLCSVLAFLAPSPLLRVELLEVGAILSSLLVWRSAASRAAKWTYLLAVALSALCAYAGALCLLAPAPELARAFLLTGALLKLGLFPMLFWLLALAEELPALSLGAIIAVVDMAAFAELLESARELPALLSPQIGLLWLGALSALLAALLMLTQRSLKRLLVLSTLEDAGFLLLGAAAYSVSGLEGAMLAATSHALAKALLFATLAAPEAAGELKGSPRALASRYPVSAFGFLFGMLAMLGAPPLIGFAGRWRLYGSALAHNPWLLATLAAASILSLLAYVMALTRLWWGAPDGPAPASEEALAASNREPWLLRAVLIALATLVLGAGLWPNLLHLLAWGRP